MGTWHNKAAPGRIYSLPSPPWSPRHDPPAPPPPPSHLRMHRPSADGGGVTCEQLTFLPAPVADSWPTSYWDTLQYWLWNGMPTAAPCSESGPRTDGSPACMCMRETYGCSIHPSGRDEWIAFMRASLARILASVDRGGASMVSALASTAKPSASLASLDRNSSSWKTAQQSLDWGSEQFLATWPVSGMTRGGHAYLLPSLAPQLSGTDGGHFPAPRTSMYKIRRWWARKHPMGNLEELPSYRPEKFAWLAGRPINPAWCEWLMLWPIMWTASKALATAKSRSARRRRGKSSEDHKP